MTPEQKRVIQAVIHVFETGSPTGDYSAAHILPDGAGISYGRSQATDGSDTLDAILYRYLDLHGHFEVQLAPFLARLAKDDTTRVSASKPPKWCLDLLQLLRDAALHDPVMRRAQDEVFDELYWVPAQQKAEKMQLTHPLSWAIVYDTCVHSGPARVEKHRKRFPALPPSRGGDEAAWATAYVATRKAWLAASPKPIVQKTVYRMETFEALIQAGNWALTTPFLAHGVTVA